MSVFIKPDYPNREWRRCIYHPIKDAAGVSKFSVLGDELTLIGSVSNIQDAQGFRTKLETTSVAQSDGGIQGSLLYARNLQSELYARFKLTSTTLVRAFIGFTNLDEPTMVTIDNPVGHYFGLSYSSQRPDTNWQYIRKDNVTQGISDTGIPVDTNPHDLLLQMISSPAQVQAQIDNSNITPFTDRLPGGTTPLRLVAAVETQTTAVKGIELGKILIVSDH